MQDSEHTVAVGTLLDGLVERLAPRVADLVVERLRGAGHVLGLPADPTGLLDKRAIARALGISQPTVDRMVREGMPFQQVGTRRRFDLVACREWATARGRKAVAPPRCAHARDLEDGDDAEIFSIAAAAGLRPAKR